MLCFYAKRLTHNPRCACVQLINRWSMTWKTVTWISYSFWAQSASSKVPCHCAWLGVLPSVQSSFFLLPRTNTRLNFSTALPRCAGLQYCDKSIYDTLLYYLYFIHHMSVQILENSIHVLQKNCPWSNIWLPRQESSGTSHVCWTQDELTLPSIHHRGQGQCWTFFLLGNLLYFLWHFRK